jgi:hypothetical protein
MSSEDLRAWLKRPEHRRVYRNKALESEANRTVICNHYPELILVKIVGYGEDDPARITYYLNQHRETEVATRWLEGFLPDQFATGQVTVRELSKAVYGLEHRSLERHVCTMLKATDRFKGKRIRRNDGVYFVEDGGLIRCFTGASLTAQQNGRRPKELT